MRFSSQCLAAALAVLAASSARAEEWRTSSAQDGVDLIASFKHVDGVTMQVVCDTAKHQLSITYQEPKANWQTGSGMDVIVLPDSGQQASPSYGFVTAPNEFIMKHDVAFDLWTLRQAKGSFKMSVGDHARVFPTANLEGAMAPVLKACGAQ